MVIHAKGEESKQSQMTNEAKRHEDLFNILVQQQKQQEFQQQQVQLHQEAMKQRQQSAVWPINNKIFRC